MKIKDINIPSEHRYLSELMDFLPGNCILNKGMCGCGGTTMQCVFIHFIKFVCLIPMLPLDFMSNHP